MKTIETTAAAAVIAAACTASVSFAQSNQSPDSETVAVDASASTTENMQTSPMSSGVDYESIAKRIVTEAAGVQPGDVVLINGSPSELKMLEALTAQAEIAGGDVIVTIELPNAYRKAIMEAPDENLSVSPSGYLALNEAVDVFINATAIEDPGLFADVPEERINLIREANKPLAEQYPGLRARSVDVGQAGGIPTEAYAQSVGADYTAMRDMFFAALEVSPEVIAERGNAVKSAIPAGAEVSVTSPAGTDLSFTIADKPARVSTGRSAENDTGSGIAAAYLPAGDFYTCIVPGSVNGTIVAPSSRIRGTEVENLSMTFEDGTMTDMSADTGQDMLSAYFDNLDEASKQVSLINIGLNPQSHMLDNSSYRSWEMGGMTSLVLGNSEWAGCDHPAEGGYTVHLDGASVVAGDADVVSEGTLAAAE